MKTFVLAILTLTVALLNAPSLLAECHPGHGGGIPISYGGGGGGGNENHPHGPGGQDLGGGGNNNIPGPDFVGPRLPEQEMPSGGSGGGQNIDPAFDGEMVSGGGTSMKGDGGGSLLGGNEDHHQDINQAQNQFNQAAGGGDSQTVQTQMAADAKKNEQERWKIMQDTQNKIFEIQQDVTVTKAQNADKNSKAWDEYINN